MSKVRQSPIRGHAIYPAPARGGMAFAMQTGLEAPAARLRPQTYAYAVGGGAGAVASIHQFRLLTQDLEVSQNVTLGPIGVAAELPGAVFLAACLERGLLVAVGNSSSNEGGRQGGLTCYSMHPRTGALRLLNRVSTGGEGACHALFHPSGRFVFVAHVVRGDVAVIPVGEDGKLGTATQVVQVAAAGSGRGVEGLALDPAGGQLLACDPAGNRVAVFRFDSGAGTLAAAGQRFVVFREPAGPRRAVFAPEGKTAYVLGGSKSTVTALRRNQEGEWTEAQTVATVPEYYDGPNACTEIAIHPGGRFLYVANNGHNSVVLLQAGEGGGDLTYVEEQGTGGKNPVHFGIQPSAKHLVIANRDTNQLLVSRIDDGNGRLKPSGVFVEMALPNCVLLIPAKEGDA